MKRALLLFLFSISFLCQIKLFAQEKENPVNIDVKNISIEGLIELIEKQTNLFFYYDLMQFDSTIFTVSVINKPVKTVLKEAFLNTKFTYTFDNEGNVFILKGDVLNLDLNSKTTNSDILKKDNAVLLKSNVAIQPDETKQKTGLEFRFFEIGNKNSQQTGKATLAGYVKNSKTGEPVIGASIFTENPRIGITTDQYGYFSLVLPKGRHILNILSINMRDTKRRIALFSDGKLDIDMQETVTSLHEVVVSGQKSGNIKSTQMGLQKIDIKTIKQVPVVFGEADLLKVITTMPGVKTVGEASNGLNVRGGSADQNLILFNEGTIYNPSHFFGMFSAFNTEAIKDVELYKSSIPTKFGGRLSSVLNINSREGNKKKISGSAGIGLLTSRINVEGPIVSEKTSFIVGARTTYANWLLKLLPDEYKNSNATFYDINLNITHEINKNNSIYLSGYLSNDQFNLNNDTLYRYGNKNVAVKFKHIFNNKLNNITNIGVDSYGYSISSSRLAPSAYKLGFDIQQQFFKSHFNYYLNEKHTLDFGINSLLYQLNPGKIEPFNANSLIKPEEVQSEKALESALYLSDHFEVNNSLSIDYGVRYSVFNYLGPQNINTYSENLPIVESNINGNKTYDAGKIIKTYGAPETRLSIRYLFNTDLSIKLGYNSQQQYIHSISNTASISPTDIWKLSDPNIKPQSGEQFSMGIYKNMNSNNIETSFEIYYKNIKNYLDFRSGAQLILSHHIETEVIGTKGKAYGAEFLIKKNNGKLNGWLSYTWSRVFLKMDDPTAGELINNGKWYPSNYDKPHDITLISNYRFSHRFSTLLNASYCTGRPITLPIGVYYYLGSYRTLYAGRNEYRIPDYFRADFAMNIEGNHKIYQKTHNSWAIGVYNISARKNPYSIYYIAEKGRIVGYKLSIFGSAIPYINFNIKF